ncbi:hypothetical protein CPSG_05019 [Coccidioides posadasii str. Silveira]|uniref:Uncharacterized protein n=1 Tax=Coccidioides posadasii (strain RMSCC 757 / Silveira) TaxID=443226 RepID=E9D5Y9_COCPS|nr:hypothetical protein CPSG_05019 [Coccidioides posadasii str. Silveira]
MEKLYVRLRCRASNPPPPARCGPGFNCVLLKPSQWPLLGTSWVSTSHPTPWMAASWERSECRANRSLGGWASDCLSSEPGRLPWPLRRLQRQ